MSLFAPYTFSYTLYAHHIDEDGPVVAGKVTTVVYLPASERRVEERPGDFVSYLLTADALAQRINGTPGACATFEDITVVRGEEADEE
jgi:hypothetical protein